MRACCIIAPVIFVLLASCKKETAPTATKDAAENNSVSQFSSQICSVENWASEPFSPNIPIVNLVYNNKVYLPQNANGNLAGDMTVTIYDGNTWQVKPSNIPIYTNYKNFAFTVGSKGYVACQFNIGKFYEYDFANNTWTQKADFPGLAEYGFTTFTVGGKGYVAGGRTNDALGYYAETWEYNPANNHWTKKANLPLGRGWSTGFSIGNKGYVVNGGVFFGYVNSLAEYDPATDTWSFKSSFPGTGRIYTQVFVINGIAYAGGGSDGVNYLKDFYKYNGSTDKWTQILDLPLGSNTVFTQNSFSINSRGYVGTYNAQGDRNLKRYTPRICVDFSTPTAR